jgi:DNA-binding NtrC family response regulator
MNERILIVEDEFIVANDLQLTLERAGYPVCGIASSVNEAREIINAEKPSLVLLDIHLKGKLNGIDLAKELRENDIAFIYLSANSNQQILEAAKATEPYGFMIKPFREKDLLVTLDIARYRHEHGAESKIRRERLLQDQLSGIIAERAEWEQTFLKIVKILQPHIPFDYLAGTTKADEFRTSGTGFLRTGFDEYQAIGMKELLTITGLKADALKKILENSPSSTTATWYNGNDFENTCVQNPMKKMLAETFEFESNLVLPLLMASGGMFVFTFFSCKPSAYNDEHLALLFRLQQLLTIALDNSMAFKTSSLPVEKVSATLPDTSHDLEIISNFEGIIGSSSSLLNVLDLLTQVAPLDTSVLILGESGTGKERIADCIHQLSPRKNKPMVKVNCAALPATLIESELFGHEKGSFTGATEKRIGKFEFADTGTIFLDEIGEMPVELQVKLLRVLQEKEIERVGGKQPIKVNVRIIAATNRNLEKEVAEGKFRLDLYYRLNVFPISLPPLRERKDDIKQLVHFFAAQFSTKFNRPFHGISQQMLLELEEYDWPGNIRELENIMEQSIILNDGKSELTLKRALPRKMIEKNNLTEMLNYNSSIQSMDDVKQLQRQTEKEYISSVLKKTNGRIRGKGGAAELLNQKPTTLESRMAKLGIKKEEFYN